ncbi:TetR/AcrR family transcriptional regulator [Frankia sp. AgPm24]|uniref:TetR/AcrR family transcriptional regulator n=1 Tax=Frankia umida TaxID=573489 RepID=A0ABT0K4K3_9ACTN|nr:MULTISPECIES: TetR/AcrR family transcriptional regulator [Frankia]MCK9878723.1 TetR/AcrR family transcriptional regulator [Frankia umida]MCK9922948.1 TetR/AcrR family transcriptional regulator [Frankia sp. AgPm24]
MNSAAAPRRRTQLERRAESEEALLDAAADLVAERGVDGASLARIGSRAGASRGLPTHHFGSKDALVARLAQRAQDRIDEQNRANAARDGLHTGNSRGLDLLLLSVTTYLKRFENPDSDDRALIVMWGATFPVEASVAGMVDAERRSRDGWTELIESGQRDASIRTDIDARTSAVLLQGLIRGLAANLMADPHLVAQGHARRACATWIASALAAPADRCTCPTGGEDRGRALATEGDPVSAPARRRDTRARADQG